MKHLSFLFASLFITLFSFAQNLDFTVAVVGSDFSAEIFLDSQPGLITDMPYWSVGESPEWADVSIASDIVESPNDFDFIIEYSLIISGVPSPNNVGENIVTVNLINPWTGDVVDVMINVITVIEAADCICPAVVAPVCGSDGVTYGNSCEAACVSVDVDYEGECESTPGCIGDFDIVEQEYIAGFAGMMLHLQVQNIGQDLGFTMASILLDNTCNSNDIFTFETWASGDVLDMYFNYACLSMSPYIEPFEAGLVLSGTGNCADVIPFVFDPQGNAVTEGCTADDGAFYANGETWNLDACTFCSCEGGNIICASASCMEPDCDNPIYIEGECCPICPEEEGCFDAAGMFYENGASWSPDDCTFCSCEGGDIMCAVVDCAMPDCDNPIYVEGECCPICPDDCEENLNDEILAIVEVFGVYDCASAATALEEFGLNCEVDLADFGPIVGIEIEPGTFLNDYCPCSCENGHDLLGCIGPQAINYNPMATTENGSCEYMTDYGCVGEDGDLFPVGAIIEYDSEVCVCIGLDAAAVMPYWECEELITTGCMDEDALNFNSQASVDDESCIYNPNNGCLDDNGLFYPVGAVFTNFEPAIGICEMCFCSPNPNSDVPEGLWECEEIIDCGFGMIPGCMDALASNYNEWANVEDGTCEYGCNCPLDLWVPVCGADGITYSYSCFAECADVDYIDGECEIIDDCICPMIYAPVCGSDGITYGNSCQAECENITEFYEGECLPTSFCEAMEVEAQTMYNANGQVQLNITVYNNSPNNINYPVFNLETANDYVTIEPLFENAYWIGAGESTTNSYLITGGGNAAALVEATYFVSQLNQNAACAYPISFTYEPLWGSQYCYSNGQAYSVGDVLTGDDWCETCICTESDAQVFPPILEWVCEEIENCGEQINYVLIMYDAWGDGWSGAEMTITNTNGDLVGVYTMEDGDFEAVELDLVDGCYNIEVSGPAYASSEISWAITENMYPAIYDGGAPFSGVFSLNADCGTDDPCNLIDCADGYECVNGDCILIEPQEFGCNDDAGNFYAFGETMEQECNTCTCTPGFNPNAEGFWMCTMLPCEEEYGCELDGELYEFGSSIDQGCNTCYCQAGFNPNANGIWACTEMACAGCTDPDALNYDEYADWDDESCEYENNASTPNWDSPNTGANHTLVLAEDMLVELDGSNIESGDWVGVFYTLDGELACAGYAIWEGSTTVIPAQGDDTTTDAQDGFNANQEFQWLVWDASANMTYSMDATYDANMPNQEQYTTNGISAILTLTAQPLIGAQELQLTDGWNLFSTYMVAEVMDAEELFAPFVEDVIIVKNNIGLAYLPSYNFNGVGDLLPGQGYQVKLSNANILTIEGDYLSPEDNPIDLVNGWNLIAYLRTEPADVIAVFEDVVELVIVKDNSGMAYLPEYGFNGIGNMTAGQAYQIKVLAAQQLQYLANNESYRFVTTAVENNLLHYKTPLNTGSNMSIVLEANQLEGVLNYGDELAVYTTTNQLVGAFVYQDQAIVIPVYGNDDYSKEQDGLLKNEALTLRYWSNEKGEEIPLNTNWNSSTGLYEQNSIQIATIERGHLELSKLDFEILPNPAKYSANISFELAENYSVSIQLYNLLGDLIYQQTAKEFNKGKNAINLSVDAYSKGTYLLKMQTNNSVCTKRLLVH